ncbi:uracil-DNA glycosylase family protein [Natrinema pallidum]|uniref:hypothetical protein n=1 Tax=Natrinema pallidum TaxID=69527 RepID=UPI0012681750|nr:hypothetical protein [Natrinema pallidum]
MLKNWLKNEGGSIDCANILDDDSTLLDGLGSADQIPNAMLEEELAAVDPELIIVSGKLPWTRFFSSDDRITPESEHQVSNTTYKVHGRPYRYNGPTGVDAKVIPLYHTSQRGYMNASAYLPSNDPVKETKNRLSASIQA